ncbi:Uncharacterised protein [Streptococcus pneumoniae]|nr:Uncharacterised protein [Streptococcus pneumoniae]
MDEKMDEKMDACISQSDDCFVLSSLWEKF